MQALTLDRLAANAYRTLGVSASATQQEIEQAARRLRIWPDPNSLPITPWDAEWLGPVRRSKSDIEHALSRINEPATRVQERLLWFHGADATKWDSAAALGRTLQALTWATDPISKHDFALGRLCVALSQDPEFADVDRWQRVLKYLDDLAESDDFLARAIQIESDGGFEKRAQLEEIAGGLHALPQAIAGSIAGRAEKALEDDDVATAMRIFVLLRSVAPEVATSCQSRIADRLEDLVIRRCNHLHEDLDKIGGKNVSAVQGQAICGGRAKFYNESIDPVLTQLQEVAGPQSDRTHRARTAVARAMAHMGQCWAMCGRMQIAEQTLEAALLLGQGTPVEQAIRENLARCRQALNRSAAPKPTTQAPGVRRGQSYIPTYAAPKKTGRSFASSSGGSSGAWRGTGVIVGLLIAVGRFITAFNSSGSSSSSPPSTYYPTYRAPSYTSQNYSPSGTGSDEPYSVSRTPRPGFPPSNPRFPSQGGSPQSPSGSGSTFTGRGP